MANGRERRNIALIGKARSGKDTVASQLVEHYGYTRVAFADPLKDAALATDPIVVNAMGEPDSLSRIVGDYGWERAKDLYPESRRILQHMGAAIRAIDPSFWLNAALAKAEAIPGPVVITDCRYGNERAALETLGFATVRVNRPGTATGGHESETELDGVPMHYLVHNGGTLEDLRRVVDELAAATS